MQHFLINSSVCLFVLWLFYKLALENTSWHHFKRYYLLGSVAIALIIPFIVVKTVTVPLEENTVFNLTNYNTTEITSGSQQIEFQWFYILLTVYLIGIVVMLWRFGKNLQAFKVKEEDIVSRYSKYQLILRQGMVVPHSFFNRIFVSKNDYDKNLIPKAVLNHEKAHLDQKHSLDILWIESLIVLFWFNPIFYIIRYSMKLNHEFLADRSVIQQGTCTSTYQKLILRHASNNYQQSMANTFHFPIIKKRFNIMKTKTSRTNGLFRSLAFIPVIVFLIFSCGQEETEFEVENQQKILEQQVQNRENALGEKLIAIFKNQKSNKVIIDEQEYTFNKEEGEYQFFNSEGALFDYKSEGYEVIVITEVLEEVTAEDIEEYNRLAKKHKAYMDENNTLIAWKDESSRMQIIYNSMTEEQKANNEPWPYLGRDVGTDFEAGQIPPPPPPPPTAVTGYKKEQIPPPPPPVEIIEVDQDFMEWRKANGRELSVALPRDYIDFYGSRMHYYIDGEKVSPESAKKQLMKEGCVGIEITEVDGVSSLKITRE